MRQCKLSFDIPGDNFYRHLIPSSNSRNLTCLTLTNLMSSAANKALNRRNTLLKLMLEVALETHAPDVGSHDFHTVEVVDFLQSKNRSVPEGLPTSEYCLDDAPSF